MVKKHLTKIIGSFLAFSMAVGTMPLQTFAEGSGHTRGAWNNVWSESFEGTELPEGWGAEDKDGDGYNWFSYETASFAHHGTRTISSESFVSDSGMALSPDNWLYLPEMTLDSDKQYLLTFYATGESYDYCNEVFGVYISTDGGTTYNQIGNDYTTGYGWKEYKVNLNSYAGQTVRVAIVHHNCYDVYQLLLDCVDLWSYSDLTADIESPVLSIDTIRKDADTIQVEAFSDEPCRLYWSMVDYGESLPETIDTSGDGLYCDADGITFDIPATGEKSLCFVAKDDALNLSDIYTKTYISAYIDLECALQRLTDITELPAVFEYELGSEELYYNSNGDRNVYADLLKCEITSKSILMMNFSGKEEYVDTYMWLYKQNDSGIDSVFYTDDSSIIEIIEPGTYYIALGGYSKSDTGLCSAIISVTEIPEDITYGNLDFTGEEIPVPAEDDKWSWDAETKTLVLKDGFSICYEGEDDTISLPNGSTIIIEGSAVIYNLNDYCYRAINCEGSLNIIGNGKDVSKLSAASYGCCICSDYYYTEDESETVPDTFNGTIEGCSIETVSIEYDGINWVYPLTIKDSSISIIAEDDGIDADDSVNIVDSEVLLNMCGDDGIYSEEGEVSVTNSVLKIWSDYECIDADDDVTITDSDLNLRSDREEGIDSSEDITVKGGRLIIVADENTLESDALTLEDVVFYLQTRNSSFDIIDIIYDCNSEDVRFSLPGKFTLYDEDGEELYSGEWQEDMLDDDNYLVYDGIAVFTASTIHEHSWSEEWESNDTHHWHKCDTPYCDEIDDEDRDGYGEHETEVRNAVEPTKTEEGYTGDVYCAVCDKLISHGTVIPVLTPDEPEDPGNDDPTDPGNDDPEVPGEDDPADPGNDDPTDPGNDDPVTPGDSSGGDIGEPPVRPDDENVPGESGEAIVPPASIEGEIPKNPDSGVQLDLTFAFAAFAASASAAAVLVRKKKNK